MASLRIRTSSGMLRSCPKSTAIAEAEILSTVSGLSCSDRMGEYSRHSNSRKRERFAKLKMQVWTISGDYPSRALGENEDPSI
jgi:hypothetical protein